MRDITNRPGAIGLCTAVILALLSASCANDDNGLSEGDIVAMRNLSEVYTSAWMADDAETVMDLFTEDAVLIPHHGAEVVEGNEDIRRFFWPADGPGVTITDFSLVPAEVSGNNGLGFVRGRFSLSFAMEENGERSVYSNDGNYLMILRKSRDGSWRVSHYIWNDPVPQVR